MIKNHAHLRFMWAFVFMFSAAAAAETLELSDGSGSYNLSRHLYVLEDPDGSLTAEDIVRPGGMKRFARNESGTVNRGYSDSAWWFGFSLKNSSAVHSRWYLELAFPTMDYFELYRISSGRAHLAAREGDTFPFDHRPIRFSNYVIPIPLQQGTALEFLIRVRTTSEVIVPLTVWTQDAFTVHSNEQSGALWFYYGIMAVMVLYNLFLFITVRDTNYLYYVFYVLLATLSNMSFNGMAYQVLWPGLPWFNSISIVLTGNLALVSFMQFSRKFLMTGRYSPRYDRAMAGFIAVVVMFIIAIFFAKLTFSIISLNTLVLVTTLLALAACIISMKNGYRPAYIYLAAMFSVFAGVSLISLRNFGVLPDTFVTRYGFQIGTSVEAVLLSLALGYRFNLLKSENEKLLLLSNEIDIARKIYRSILTSEIPPVKDMVIEALVMPMSLIGGDFLEPVSVREGAVGLFLADVSGHGVPASIGAAMLKMAFANNQHLAESPAELMTSVDRAMAGRMGQQFVTATYTFIDTGKNILRHCNAGHVATLLVRENSDAVIRLLPAGRAIGPFQNNAFEMDEVQIGRGDRIVLFTDGIIECRNAAGKIFGEQKLLDLVRDLRGSRPEELKNEILAALYEWIHPATAFDDDCTLVIVDITGQ